MNQVFSFEVAIIIFFVSYAINVLILFINAPFFCLQYCLDLHFPM